MAAPPLAHTFETGQPDGTAVTVGNSGVGGNAFDTSSGTIADLTYSIAHSKSASLSYQVFTGGTFATAAFIWTGLGAITTDFWLRYYVWLPSIPTTTLVPQSSFNNAAGACFYSAIGSDGKMQMQNAAGTGLIGGAVNITIGSWVRIECRVKPSLTVGELEWWLYNTTDAPLGSHDDHNSTASAVLAANIDTIRWGCPKTAGGPNNYTFWIDDIAVSTTGQIGPSPGGQPDNRIYLTQSNLRLA